MPPLENLAAFIVASLVIIPIPGPSVVFIVGRSIALGRRGGLLSVLGNALGMLPLLLLVAAGLGAIIAASAIAFTLIKFAGAAYLVWLGIKAIRHRNDPPPAGATTPRSTLRLLGEGFVVGVTNPKTLAFFVAMLPQFVDPGRGAVPMQLAILGVIFVGLALVGDSVWAVAAGTVRTWFTRSPKRLSALSATGGVAMIGLGGAVALSNQRV
ncbi:LysE family translocator [Microbacterium sp. P06]|uniref:LysE family translocator n=1 Tax=unclassified Microbacterium TaxID=2609290 RepID=UPI00374721E7